MKDVDLYLKVRHAVRIEGLSERAAARRFGIDPRTVNKMMKFSVPPGYVRKKPPAKPKLDPFIPVIDRILGDDKSRPKKQLHTAKRIFERLRDEYGFTGGITIVKDYVAGWRQRAQEMFVSHGAARNADHTPALPELPIWMMRWSSRISNRSAIMSSGWSEAGSRFSAYSSSSPALPGRPISISTGRCLGRTPRPTRSALADRSYLVLRFWWRPIS